NSPLDNSRTTIQVGAACRVGVIAGIDARGLGSKPKVPTGRIQEHRCVRDVTRTTRQRNSAEVVQVPFGIICQISVASDHVEIKDTIVERAPPRSSASAIGAGT